MTLWQRIAARWFGAQYVMVRQSHQLTFACCRATLIGNRYYVRRLKWESNVSAQQATKPHHYGPYYWLLTNKGRVSKFEEEHPDSDMMGTFFSHGVWLPITSEVDAHVRMTEE